ncbi:hypothetical protein LINGRAHAP2_LOCUS10628, partial [Linum grandiflorum]
SVTEVPRRPTCRPPRDATTDEPGIRRRTRNGTRVQPAPVDQTSMPTVQTGRRRRRCSLCMAENHNARTCLRQQGIQANQVQPISRQQQEREVEQAMRGVGAYVSPTTGNTYYRGSSRPPNE